MSTSAARGRLSGRLSEGSGRHTHSFERAALVGFSRRQFLRGGAVAIGALAGLGLVDAPPALGQSGSDPRPIPGGFLLANFAEVPSNPDIHVLTPAVGHEMSTIMDFNGVVAAAEIQGTAKGSDGSMYTFDTDMRFMQGLYIGVDGRLRQGSFGFVWIDLFTGAPLASPQVHDFEPGIEPSGLFWTIRMPASVFEAVPGAGRARFKADLDMPDFHDFVNAISPSPTRTPGHVSFDVRWAGGGDRRNIRDRVFSFAGEYVTGDATISFIVSDNNSPVTYTSDPGGQLNPGPPGVGHERNGFFFRR